MSGPNGRCPRPGCGGPTFEDGDGECYCLSCGWRRNEPVPSPLHSDPPTVTRGGWHCTGQAFGRRKRSRASQVAILRCAQREGYYAARERYGVSLRTLYRWRDTKWGQAVIGEIEEVRA